MNFQSPRLSVVMAAHNGLEYLPQAVESILCQTFSSFEFIIIDDGSADGAGEWLEQISTRDKRIRLKHQGNSGLTVALNRGLRLARGELIARMDADDVARPNRLELQVAFMDLHPEVVLLGSEVELITANGLPLGCRQHAHYHPEIRRRLLQGDGGAVTHPAAMIRRSALEKVGLYDERFTTAQDLDLFLRLSEVGEARNLPQTLLDWRQHSKSINRTRSQTWMAMKRLAIQKSLERCTPEQFATDLFPVPLEFSFPEGHLQLARRAEKGGRILTAMRLAAQGCAVPGERFASVRYISGLTLRILYRSFKLQLSKIRKSRSFFQSESQSLK